MLCRTLLLHSSLLYPECVEVVAADAKSRSDVDPRAAAVDSPLVGTWDREEYTLLAGPMYPRGREDDAERTSMILEVIFICIKFCIKPWILK